MAAAGVLAELVIACIGLGLWLGSDSLLLRDIGFDLALIGGVSTVLFNANPLLKFDGYYLLSEWLGLQNLATRSKDYLQQQSLKYLFGIRLDALSLLPGEKGWLLGYGVSAIIYRIFLSLSIALYVSTFWFWLGLTLALWALVLQIGWPLLKFCFIALRKGAEQGVKIRCSLGFMLCIFLGGALFFTPFKTSTHAHGVVTLHQDAQLRLKSSGFVKAIYVKNGQWVEEGESLLALDNPELRVRQQKLELQLTRARNERSRYLVSEPAKSQLQQEKLRKLHTELADNRQRIQGLTLKARRSGYLNIHGIRDLQGRYLKQGTAVGYVDNLQTVEIQTLLPAPVAQQIRGQLHSARVRFHSGTGPETKVARIHEVPQATDVLPTPLLGSLAGGDIRVDTRDSSGTRLLAPMFLFNLELPQVKGRRYLGRHVTIRFEHPPRSLAQMIHGALQGWWDQGVV